MKNVIAIFLTVLLIGCATNTIGITTELEPGMSGDEVRTIMGNPKSSEFVDGFLIWKYSLHEPWVGFIPYYLAFDKNRVLVGWQSNMDEYYATQSLWLQSLPKHHNVNINGSITHTIID